MTPLPASEIIFIAICNCSPQSQRCEPKTSPVTHWLWTRTSVGSSLATSPNTSAMCSSGSVIARYATHSHSPYSVGSFVSATRRTSFSLCMRYSMSCVTLMICRLCRFAKRLSCGSRDMVPSWFMISHRTPAG